MDPKEAARQKIQELVERFEEQKDFYYRSEYNETATRRDFIDPFFKALGWDVANEQGYAETYREVIHEDRVKDHKRNNGRSTFPDYSFRLSGGKRLFFVEAKKPSIYIKQQVTPAFQVRTYGWSAGLPISIITDFEEFAVYDCTQKPRATDKADTARLKYIKYEDYLKEFDFIWNTFSRERVLKGSFDRFIDDENKKGSTPVDVDFLNSLTRWRKLLATDILHNHTGINESDLTFAVQEIINRIVFLRIAEDRDVERYGHLKEALQHGSYYNNLLYIFSQANEKYNAEFFSLGQSDITHTLKIDNRTIKAIINNLYFPDSSYAFAVIPIEIMGTAYEQFLGKCIRITAGNRIKIEDKPEVRKAGGVYYTPQYIVDYIVEKTIKPLIDGKAPKEIAKIRIIDPACGSGSFLIRAYQFLLDYHRDYYLAHSKIPRHRKDSPLTPDGYLTSEVKKRILLNNIYGVDIDRNAVQVTKMALLLKCMEGETIASIETQLRLFHEPLLPAMHNNIKTGNSLVDTDYYDEEPDLQEVLKISPFNWKKAFPEVFRQGGFDVVIGNPPYVLAEINEAYRKYLLRKYPLQQGKLDLYRLFTELSHQVLKEKGRFSFIIPNSILTIPAAKELRKYLLTKGGLEEIVTFWGEVFENVSVNSIILVSEKGSRQKVLKIISDNSREPGFLTLAEASGTTTSLLKKDILADDQCLIKTNSSKTTEQILARIRDNCVKLSEIAEYTLGMQVYHNTMHSQAAIKNRKFHSKKQLDDTYFPESGGTNIRPYAFKDTFSEFVSYGDWCYNKPDWKFCMGERILIREIPNRNTLNCCITDTVHIPNKAVIVVVGKDVSNKFLLGILNSRLMGFYVFKSTEKGHQRLFPRISLTTIKNLPVKVNGTLRTREIQNEIVKQVDRLIKLYKDQHKERMLSSMVHRETYIEHCEEKINQLVYELYNLPEADIEIIERSFEKVYPVVQP